MVIPNGKFKDHWDNLGAQGQRDGNLSELSQTFQLPFKSMNVAVNGVIQFFSTMSVCDGSNKINVTEKVHTLLLSGIFNGTHQVFAKGQIGFNQEYGCVIKLTVRSLDTGVSQSLMECIN
jgi:coatomer protein complex subunit gamma